MSFIQDWDSGGTWDSGLEWDVNVGPSPGTVAAWISDITSEHISKPKFVSMVSATLQALADNIALLQSMPGLFDLDVAAGAQLDVCGQWIGLTRYITTPLTGVFFSWDVDGQGWREGSWSADVNQTELVELPDLQYRTLLYARVAANHWNGSIPGAYAVWNAAFAATDYGVLIQDLQGMHMCMALTGPVPDAVTLAMFTGGYLSLKPAAVRIDKYYTPVVNDAPYFAYGVANDNLAGWGSGYWGVASPGN